MTDAETTRRRFIKAAGTVAVVGLAGCVETTTYADNHSIVNVQVVKQATRVGVKVTVTSHQFQGETVPVRVELYDHDGERIKAGYVTVGMSGGGTDSNTVWFELESVEATKRAYRANAEIATENEYEDATGESL